MKNSTLTAIMNYLNGATITNLDEVREELAAEIAHRTAKASANRELYTTMHDIVMGVLADAEEPMTVSDIYQACADELPEGATKSKIQYALRALWADEVTKHDNGKNPFTYSKA